MNVLVDTSVWSLALRRRQTEASAPVGELRELVREGRVRVIGPVRQELLSGIRESAQFRRLRDAMRAFPDQGLTIGDFERAAELFNRCRSQGIQGSNTDFLLCAVAERLDLAIFTTDQDFSLFAQCFPLKLHLSRPA